MGRFTPKYPESLFEHLAEDYARLGTRRKVAELYGCSPSLVEKKLHAMAIPRLSAQEAARRYWSTAEAHGAARERYLRRVARGDPMPRVSTLERMFADALTKSGVSYQAQVPIHPYIVDFLLADQVVVEVDGWQHRIPAHQERDALRDANLNERGFKVFRFTGQQIHRDVSACVRWVQEHASIPESASPSAEWLSGKGRRTTKPVSQSTRRKMSAAKRNHWKDPQKRAAMQSGIRRGQHTEAYREKVSAQRTAFMQSQWSDPEKRALRQEAIRRARQPSSQHDRP